uniref:Cullin-2 n=1 Tax=Aceria tosichella TaxID=561515 RepID=A0A6G1SIR9_9ACAR
MSLRSDPINFEDYWPPIEKLLLNILNQRYKQVTNERWQETFFDIYKVCVAQPEPLVGVLYARLKSMLQTHVQELCQEVSRSDNLLESYYKYWTTYRTAAEYFDKLFNYLNAQHLKKIKKPMQADVSSESVCQPGLEVKDLCLYLWNQDMITPIKKPLVDLLMRGIELERNGGNINQSVISGIIHSLAEVEEYKKDDTLELYRETFEIEFLRSTGEFYRAEAERLRSESNCSDYMRKVLQIIDLETLRCTKFIHSSSKDKVISEIRARMVADHSKFLYKEAEYMVASDCWQDLHAMYKLLKPIDGGLKTLIQLVQSRITQVGLETIKQVATSDNPPKDFVESFIQVHKKHSDLIATTFNNDQLFVGALDKACSSIINFRLNPQQPCRSPELLAKYCDNLLRKPSSGSGSSGSAIKGLSDAEIDEKLSLSIIVFKYIDDKDIFQKFYSKNMARRLIFSQLSLLDHEESMINKLKQVCGYEFTAKLHRMFTDIGVSNELKGAFEQHLRQKNAQLGISFSIYVLQAGSWPLGQSPVTSFALPEVFLHSVQAFEDYYYTRFNGRVLTWLYHHCTADLKLCYYDNNTAKRKYSVSMQTFHAAILLLFETKDELSYEEISKATQLSDEQLSKHLQGLLEAKILLVGEEALAGDASTSCQQNVALPQQASSRSDGSSPPSAQQYSFIPTTKIRFNLQFTSRKTKFKIAVVQRDNQYQQIREQNDSELTHSSIDEDRKLYIQAAIVRVMKSRKSAKHNQLIKEVIDLTKNHFTPSVPMIKKCIEILIEKQYLERKSSAADEYKYVA